MNIDNPRAIIGQSAALYINKSKTPINVYLKSYEPGFDSLNKPSQQMAWHFESDVRSLKNRLKRFKTLESIKIIQGVLDGSCIVIKARLENVTISLEWVPSIVIDITIT